jgi:tRNA threonylcarbamoyladenosine biosynthesis protein TsaE
MAAVKRSRIQLQFHVVRRESTSSAQTEQIGAELASGLEPGDVVLISGDLGAGKTTLVRGACRALGVDGPVTSPTFAIGNRYRGERCLIAHLDLYRLGSLADEDPDLLADYLGPDLIAFVEWPDLAEPELAGLGRIAMRIQLSHAGQDRRVIELR